MYWSDGNYQVDFSPSTASRVDQFFKRSSEKPKHLDRLGMINHLRLVLLEDVREAPNEVQRHAEIANALRALDSPAIYLRGGSNNSEWGIEEVSIHEAQLVVRRRHNSKTLKTSVATLAPPVLQALSEATIDLPSDENLGRGIFDMLLVVLGASTFTIRYFTAASARDVAKYRVFVEAYERWTIQAREGDLVGPEFC